MESRQQKAELLPNSEADHRPRGGQVLLSSGQAQGEEVEVILPRISIRFCTQCHWMLRAAYYAQELLSTFSTSIGEVALIPATGGLFTVDITHHISTLSPEKEGGEERQKEEEEEEKGREEKKEDRTATMTTTTTTTTRLWDRKAQGGFPETKTLKQLIRNIIDPTRDLGHFDRSIQPKPKPQPSN